MATSRRGRKVEVEDEDQFFKDFPRLKGSGFRVTSPATPFANFPLVHNCFAYTIGERQWWWPDDYGRWPADCRFGETLQSFVCAYARYGFTPCADGAFEPAVEKIAVYAKGEGEEERITHVAIQLPSGQGVWRSKCGANVDVEHALDGLSGDCYGTPRYFLCRRTAGKRSSSKNRRDG